MGPTVHKVHRLIFVGFGGWLMLKPFCGGLRGNARGEEQYLLIMVSFRKKLNVMIYIHKQKKTMITLLLHEFLLRTVGSNYVLYIKCIPIRIYCRYYVIIRQWP